MKIAVFATLLVSAAAFSPVKQAAKTSALSASAFGNELGVQEPVSHTSYRVVPIFRFAYSCLKPDIASLVHLARLLRSRGYAR